MIGYSRRWGDTLDLIQDCRGVFILDLASLYGIQAIQRVIMALVGWALRAMGLHHSKALIATPWASSTPDIACSCPNHTKTMMHLDHIAQSATHFHLTLHSWSKAWTRFCLIQRNIGGLKSSSIPHLWRINLLLSHWRSMRPLIVPHIHLGAPQDVLLEIKGQPP